VRLESPEALLQALAGGRATATDSLVQTALAEGETLSLGLDLPVPVHLVYLTAWVDEAGLLQLRHDCYGYDGQLALALATPRTAPDPAPRPQIPALVAGPGPAARPAAYQERTGPVS